MGFPQDCCEIAVGLLWYWLGAVGLLSDFCGIAVVLPRHCYSIVGIAIGLPWDCCGLAV